MVQDDEIIRIAKSEISGGTAGKMTIAMNISQQAGCPRSKAISILDKYTGSNPAKHLWSTTKGAKGVIVYSLLEKSTVVTDKATDLVVLEDDFAGADF